MANRFPEKKGTFKVNTTRAAQSVKVTPDGRGVTGHVGALLLAEIADRTGLVSGLSVAMEDTFSRRPSHDRGVTLAHIAVAIADGADCLSDLATLAAQGELFGPVAANSTAWRTIESVCSVELRGIATARADARAAIWSTGCAPETVTIDVDSTLVDSHSEKQDAAPTYKRGFGFHPMVAFVDETEEFLAATLRPGNAGANDANDHIDLLNRALAQLPEEFRSGRMPDDVCEPKSKICLRADSAGATHVFVDELAARSIDYSIGFAVDGRLRRAISQVPELDWVDAIETDGSPRDGAEVVEVTDRIDLSGWPEATRLIVRRERPHPGAQLSLFDEASGYRHQAFITNGALGAPGAELFHRQHARVEDKIRAAKSSGLANFPFEDFVRNQAWLALVTIAADLIAWAKMLCLSDEFARAEPKRIRYAILHVAARIIHTGRKVIVAIDAAWPWARELAAAFIRLRRVLPA